MPYGHVPANQAGMLIAGQTIFANNNIGRLVTPTLQGNFRDQSIIGNLSDEDYDFVGYRVDQGGFVTLTGLVNAVNYTTGFSPGGSGLLLFTITQPELRPSAAVAFPVVGDTNVGTMIVRVHADGTVWIIATGLTAGPARITLDGCQYWVGRANVLAVFPELAMTTTGAAIAENKVVQNEATEISNGTSVIVSPWVASGTITPHSLYGVSRYSLTGALTGPPVTPTTAGTPAWKTSDNNFNPNPDFVTDQKLIFPVAGITSGSPWIDRCDLWNNASFVPELLPQRGFISTSIMYLQGIKGSNAPGTVGFWGPPTGTFGNRPANADMWDDVDYAWGFDGWYDLTLLSPWVNYLSGFRKAQYARDWYGNIYLRGLIKDGGMADIGQLPAAFHGAYKSANVVWTSQGASKLQISVTGGLGMSALTAYTGGVGHWVSLSGVIIWA